MQFTAAITIDSARDLSPYFGEEDNPNRLVNKELYRIVQRLFGKVAEVRPDELSQELKTIAIPADETAFADGVGFFSTSGSIMIRDAVAQLAADSTLAGRVPVEVVPYGARHWQTRFPYIYTQQHDVSSVSYDQRIFLGGRLADWVLYASLIVRYMVPTTTFDAGNGNWELPGPDAETAVIERLAEFMAQRVKSVGAPVDVAYFRERANAAEADYLNRVTNAMRGEKHRIIEAY